VGYETKGESTGNGVGIPGFCEILPFIKSVSKEGPYLNMAWEGFGPVELQRATSITHPDRQDLIGSENTNFVSLPIWGGTEFFRLAKP
jgi:hypothetical protein